MNIDVLDSREYKLKNGLRVVSIRKDTKLMSIQIGINAGPIHEQRQEKGMSHFIEHMLFKGTINRDNEKINEDLEDKAGSYNAYTTYTSTVFGISALCDELSSSAEILSDMIKNSTLPDEELEKEKTVILAEIRNGADDVEHLSFSKVNETAFLKSHLRYDIAGNEKLVCSFKRESLMNFYKKFYVPTNAVVSIVSPFTHSEVETIVDAYFSDWMGEEFKVGEIEDEQNRSVIETSYKNDIEQNTILYLYTFYGLDDKQELALDILNYKLGESANSILFRELREKRGMAYDVYSDTDRTNHIKTLYIYTSVGESDVGEARETIDDIINKIVNEKMYIDKENINHMKKVMKTGIISMIEDNDSLCNYVLHQKMSDRKINHFLDDLETLEEIEVDEVYEVAKDILKHPTVHILLGK